MKQSNESSLDQSVQNSETQEPFLRRWSNRKLGKAQAPVDDADNAVDVPPNANEQVTQTSPAEPVEEPQQTQLELTDDDMPAVETLDEHSDFSMFLSPKVSETLRRQALRKLFHFQQFNITDGLNDYDEDYTDFETLGDIIPHDMKRMLRREAEKPSSDSDDTQQKLDNEISQEEELAHQQNADTDNEIKEEATISVAEEDQESSVVLSNQQSTNS